MWESLKRLQGLHWAVLFGAGVVAVMLAMAVVIFLLILFGEHLTPVPLEVQRVESGMAGSVCPGDEVVSTLYYTLNESLVIEVFGVIMDADHRFTYVGVRDDHTIIPQQFAGEYRQDFPWTIPTLPSGEYAYALPFWMRGVGADPVYQYVHFVIGAGC